MCDECIFYKSEVCNNVDCPYYGEIVSCEHCANFVKKNLCKCKFCFFYRDGICNNIKSRFYGSRTDVHYCNYFKEDLKK